ncbi:amino acid ABC transporter permease [Streptomyces durbertensis]|uniref:Histidine/lysine/arginine/ornithine transport system permease protein HisM n=1 Tax=Streptomyces durbertensis TaxID=2448886 RepID=A0ABR6ELI2_9ACTN|nr:ABC transporter permease subunit [Streptomyces durbertensis]MBB1246211.1 amino acid ABC transporter permease [Streptomyces durbertensis]
MTEPNDKAPAVNDDGGAKVAPEAIKAVPVRHYGRWISSAITIVLVGALVLAFARGQIQWTVVGDHILDERVIRGAWETLKLTVYAMLIGVGLGMLLAVMRLSKNPVLRSVAWGYIWFFRGTPVLVQLFLWFNLSLVFTYVDLGPIYKNEMIDVMTPFMAALLGLGLNEAAYMAEIGRAGIQSVDRGQTEAAHALGMSPARTTRRIVLPQAMRVIVPPTGNEFINMLKTSSLAYIIGFSELFLVSREVGSVNLAVMEMLIVVTIWYLILTTIFSIGQYYLERHYARGSDRELPPTPLQKIRANVFSFRRPAGPGGAAA